MDINRVKDGLILMYKLNTFVLEQEKEETIGRIVKKQAFDNKVGLEYNEYSGIDECFKDEDREKGWGAGWSI